MGVAAIFAVPLVTVLLLAWTFVGFLCSLPGYASCALILALVIAACVADPDILGGEGSYAFDSSLLGE